MQITIILALVTVTALSWASVRGFRAWALRRSLLDIPNQRSSHIQPTPRGGGLVIALVTIVGWLALQGVFVQTSWKIAVAYALGAATIAAISWIDDLHSVSCRPRLAIHLLGALLAVAAFGGWHTIELPWGQPVHLGYFGVALTVVWIIGLTNAYNFMDGSDGMAGSQGVIAGLGWACLGLLSGSPLVTGIALLLTGATLGFLLHNWPPARIFMGDVGSAFLGYSFAVLPLLGLHEKGPLASASPILGLLLVWPFVFDAAFTFLRRLRNGENVFDAHRSHLYQRLIIAGHSHRFVMILYSALAIVGSAAGVLWLKQPTLAFWCSAVLFPSLAWMLLGFVDSQERLAQEVEEEPRTLPMPQRPQPLPQRRRAA